MSSDESIAGGFVGCVLGGLATHLSPLPQLASAPHESASLNEHVAPSFSVASHAWVFELHQRSLARSHTKPRPGAGDGPSKLVNPACLVPRHGVSPSLPSMTSWQIDVVVVDPGGPLVSNEQLTVPSFDGAQSRSLWQLAPGGFVPGGPANAF